MALNIHLTNVDGIASADSAANSYFIDVVGNKTDTSSVAETASIIALLRNIIANINSDTDVTALIGELTTAAATGAVTDTAVLMAYIKQLVTELQVADANVDAILVDTNELQMDLVDGGRLDLLIDAIKAVTDLLPDAGALTSIAQASTLGIPTGADLATDIANMQLGIPKIVDVFSVDASVTPWTQASHALFTVTGVAMVRVFATIEETLVGAGTLEVGVAGATAGLIAQVADATTLTAGDILANSGTASLIPLGVTNEYAIVSNTDIDLTVGTVNITDGTIIFYCQWIPVSNGATVVAAVWD